MAYHSRAAAAGGQRGFSLIEVLIALLLVALGVLGAAALQLNALRYTQDSAYRAQAALLVTDLLERMRANPDQRALYAGSIAGECTEEFDPPLSVLAQDRIDFASGVTCQLPQGRARTTVDGKAVSVRVSWSQARIEGSTDDELVLAVQLGGGA